MAVPHPRPPSPEHALKKHGLYLSLAPAALIARYLRSESRNMYSGVTVAAKLQWQVTVAVNEKGF